MRFVLAAVAVLLAAPAFAQQTEGPIEVLTLAGERKTIYPQWRWINPNPLGDALNPVRVHGKAGQGAYLSRLICPEGGAPVFRQISATRGGPYGSPLDIFMVTCVNIARRVHLDDSHVAEYVERRAIDGFKIRDP
jgi:hypothetical protein